ncbi:MAG: hypothetical protein HPAVJP_0460 [Candidatus Hepatoplasma vulgare]|nr:MAG: hypothetical protein HPAVJP_0460 [Candidatus Hepatoplasma sp.]
MIKNNKFNVKKISKYLLDDKVIVFPTETVYGIIGIVNDENKEKINKIKGRDLKQQLQVTFPNLREAYEWINVTPYQKSILEQELPGNKSFIVKTSELGKEKIKEATILIRVPSIVYAKNYVNLLKIVGPIYSTSANIHNEKELKKHKEILEKLNVDYVIKGKYKKEQKSSQIFSLVNDSVKLIRG